MWTETAVDAQDVSPFGKEKTHKFWVHSNKCKQVKIGVKKDTTEDDISSVGKTLANGLTAEYFKRLG